MDSLSKKTLFASFKSVWFVVRFIIFDKKSLANSSKTKSTMLSITLNLLKVNLVHTVEGNETFIEDGADYDIDYVFTAYHTRDENGFTTNNIYQRKGNTFFINKRELINSIKK